MFELFSDLFMFDEPTPESELVESHEAASPEDALPADLTAAVATPAPAAALAPEPELPEPVSPAAQAALPQAPSSVQEPDQPVSGPEVNPASPSPSAPAASAGSQPEEAAASALAEAYKKLPGIVPSMIRGKSVAEVQAAYEAAQNEYTRIKSEVTQGLAANLPGGHMSGAGPAPADPLDMIALGLKQK